jgi:ribulose-5-phosphate 4-epimerase/fuculose-1-phosphate aldolase
MRSHGITTVGRDVEEAIVYAVTLYDFAKMNYQSRQIASPRPIRDDDMAVFRKMQVKERPTPENPGKLSTWSTAFGGFIRAD